MNRRSAAITLVETLVAIGVVGVLLAIALPALFRARGSGATAAAMADQRERGLVVVQYAAANRDGFPFYGIPGTNRGPLYDPAGELVVDSYWSQPSCWLPFLEWTGVVEGMFPRVRRFDDPLYFEAPVDHLTYGAYAPPSFWKAGAPQREEGHQLQRTASILHPSKKVLLLRSNVLGSPVPGNNHSYIVWFGDGHGRHVREGDLQPAVPLRFWIPGGIRGLTTEDGLEGRDL